ncbi:glycoside hydrolase family 2 TIM barrel-domain containing protein [Nigerium massiliense]|uniref:glycoside hydrolase family 2 TIM barrel-domain containing protein n=1 Tax=Nigerium massiliense TaxID=1522317 RepID=UPI0011C82A67|nr:glycoside hydrolase family 2 TIM barrel-domain containing protein [Nigerium massiliense]
MLRPQDDDVRGDPGSAAVSSREGHSHRACEGTPVLVAEGDPGTHPLPPPIWSQEYEQEYLEAHHAVFDEFEQIVGRPMSGFADFATSMRQFPRVGRAPRGVLTRDRQPEAAPHYLRSAWATDRAMDPFHPHHRRKRKND